MLRSRRQNIEQVVGRSTDHAPGTGQPPTAHQHRPPAAAATSTVPSMWTFSSIDTTSTRRRQYNRNQPDITTRCAIRRYYERRQHRERPVVAVSGRQALSNFHHHRHQRIPDALSLRNIFVTKNYQNLSTKIDSTVIS